MYPRFMLAATSFPRTGVGFLLFVTLLQTKLPDHSSFHAFAASQIASSLRGGVGSRLMCGVRSGELATGGDFGVVLLEDRLLSSAERSEGRARGERLVGDLWRGATGALPRSGPGSGLRDDPAADCGRGACSRLTGSELGDRRDAPSRLLTE